MIFRDDIKPQDVIEEQVFVVERLLGRRSMMRKGKRIERETQYLVKWDGYGIHECSWCVRSTSFFFPTVSNPHHLKNLSWIGPLNKWYQGIPCQPETSRYQISEKLWSRIVQRRVGVVKKYCHIVERSDKSLGSQDWTSPRRPANSDLKCISDPLFIGHYDVT